MLGLVREGWGRERRKRRVRYNDGHWAMVLRFVGVASERVEGVLCKEG